MSPPENFTEADLSPPVRDYLVNLGYSVRAEVKGCDLAAERDGELIIIELKKSFGLKLVYQALERLSLTDQVYVAIPRPKKISTPEYKGMLRLLKRLELGLVTVAMDSPIHTVDIPLYPTAHARARRNPKRRESLLKEMNGRLMDLNKGGSSRTKIITAYRERCIKLACILKNHGPKRPRELIAEFGCEKDTPAILQRNFDGWFERIEKGVYGLSAEGYEYLKEPNALAEYYIELYGTFMAQANYENFEDNLQT